MKYVELTKAGRDVVFLESRCRSSYNVYLLKALYGPSCVRTKTKLRATAYIFRLGFGSATAELQDMVGEPVLPVLSAVEGSVFILSVAEVVERVEPYLENVSYD